MRQSVTKRTLFGKVNPTIFKNPAAAKASSIYFTKQILTVKRCGLIKWAQLMTSKMGAWPRERVGHFSEFKHILNYLVMMTWL